MQDSIGPLISELEILTDEQSKALNSEDIPHFQELALRRKEVLQELEQLYRVDSNQFQSNNEYVNALEVVSKKENENILHLKELMDNIKSQLKQMSIGKSAFYAYVGKSQLSTEHTYFFDKHQS